MIYVIYDTNVLVSANLKKDSIPAFVIRYSFSRIVKLVYSKEINDEYKEVLSRKKFNIDKNKLNEFLNYIILFGEEIDVDDKEVDLIDKSDIPFYKAFLEKRKSDGLVFLVTGNKKHFPIDPFIVSPREFYELIENLRYLIIK